MVISLNEVIKCFWICSFILMHIFCHTMHFHGLYHDGTTDFRFYTVIWLSNFLLETTSSRQLNCSKQSCEKLTEQYQSGNGNKKIFQGTEYAAEYSEPPRGLLTLSGSCRAPWLRWETQSYNISCLAASQGAALCLFKNLT